MITLQSVTQHNFVDCIKLQVAPEQENFVTSNLHSIAEAYVYNTWTPLAIYNNDEAVGFVMFGFGEQSQKWWIIRFMIDHRHQGKGYGRTALQQVIDLLKQKPDCREIMIDYDPNNVVAARLYESLGFVATDDGRHGETVARLRLDKIREGIAH